MLKTLKNTTKVELIIKIKKKYLNLFVWFNSTVKVIFNGATIEKTIHKRSEILK